MDILEMFLSAILQGVGFTIGIVISIGVIIFVVRQKLQDIKVNPFSLFKNFKS